MNQSLVLTKNSTDTPQTFAMTSQDAVGSSRINTATTLAAPETIVIKHNVSKPKGGPVVNRHLVSANKTVIDGNGNPRTLTVNLTIAAPQTNALTDVMVDDTVDYVRQLVADPSLLAALLRGER